MTTRTLAIIVALGVTLGGPGNADAQGFDLRQALRDTGYKPKTTAPRPSRAQVRARARVIRGGLSAHRRLVKTGARVQMPSSNILTDQVAAAKKYSDSWTCRESSRLLIKSLSGMANGLKLSSSGKNTFKWGKEGWVSYHYYAVDDPKRPTLLLDPTASSNFAKDARPGGLMHSFLTEAGKQLGHPGAADRVAKRIAGGGHDGLLVLATQPEIDVYRAALEAAAKRRAQVTRNQETTGNP